MKPLLHTLRAAGVLLAWLLVVGCGGGPKTRMDTSALQLAFASADPSLKGPAEQTIQSLQAGKYLDGANGLAALAKSGEKLNDDQRKAIVGVVETLQLIMSEDATKSDLQVYQALENTMASLDDREAPKVGTNPDAVRPPPPAAE